MRVTALLLFLLLSWLTAAARVLHVPTPYATLSSALRVNQPGDTVELAAGDHSFDGISSLDHQVTLRGVGAARLLLSGSLWCTSEVRLEGLELRHSQGSILRLSGQHVSLADCRVTGESAFVDSYASLSFTHCRLDSLGTLGASQQSPPVVLYQCELRDIGCLDLAPHPGLLFESCLLERVGSFGNQGWVGYDEGELRFHNCTLVDCGGVGTSLNYLELNRCLLLRPQGSLLGSGQLEPDLFEIRESDIWSEGESCWGGSLEPLLGVYGNIEADPLICSEVVDDYRVSISSPCLLDSLGSMWMGAGGVGCGPLIREIHVETENAGLPQAVTFHAEVLGLVEQLEWDVSGDGLPEGAGASFTRSWELPGDYQVSLTVRGGGYVAQQLSPLVHVGGTVRSVSSNSEFRAALDLAETGDLLRLGPGTFLAAGLAVPPGVLLAGQPGATILEGDGEQPLLELTLGDSFLLLQDLILQHGVAEQGGALGLAFDTAATSPRLWLRRCEFRDNHAAQAGGALALPTPVRGLDLRLDSCRFTGNQARRGGALFGHGLRLRGCDFQGNVAEEDGGALCALDSAVVDSCSFDDNRAGRGGALSLDGPAQLQACEFRNNQAREDGGAVWNAPWFQLHGARYQRCLFVGNTAGGSGAALWDHGGPQLERCTLAFDSCAAEGAAADLAALPGGEPVRVSRSLLTLSWSGRGLAVSAGDVEIQCTDIWGNAGGDWTGPLEDELEGPGNRRVDPRYCAPWAGDFSLQADSPCRPEHDANCGGLGAVAADCPVTELGDPAQRPGGAQLAPPWPNPFNPDCWLEFELARSGWVRLVVVNLAGQEVARLCDGTLGAGRHQRSFQGARLASGVYLARLETEAGVAQRKLLLLK